jgi:phenylacetate 2-hydroxylase
MCSGQYIAARLLYVALIRLITSYRIVASETEPPNTDYVEYNAIKTALVAIPRDFKVRLIPRDNKAVDSALEEARGRTEFAYRA